MMKLSMLFVALALIVFSKNAHAMQETNSTVPAICGPSQRMFDVIVKEYGEKIEWVGMEADKKTTIIVFENKAQKSYTVVKMFNENRTACVLSFGESLGKI